jgi:phosphoglycolate phosphatase
MTDVNACHMPALIFDYDGVIADSLDYFVGSFLDACREHNIGTLKTRHDFLRLFDTNLYEGMAQAGIAEDTMRPLLCSMGELLRVREHSYGLFAGIGAVLQRLGGSYPLYVVTSNVARVVREHLSVHGVSCFRRILGSEDDTSKVRKIQTVRRLHAGLPCYYIGDTVGDMLEGREAGAKTVAVAWGWHGRERLAGTGPDFVADSPADLLALFEARKQAP